jgi:hypothetical protein
MKSFSELTKDFSPERREHIESKKDDLRQQLYKPLKPNIQPLPKIRSDISNPYDSSGCPKVE